MPKDAPDAAPAMRLVNPDVPDADLLRMRQLDGKTGIPGLGPWLDDMRRGWLARNAEIYHLLEWNERLAGYVGMVPLYPNTYDAYLSGARYPFLDLHPDDILTTREYAQARREGLWILLESFCCLNGEASRELSEFTFGYLSGMNVRGLLTTTSHPDGEAHCQWWGFVEKYERGACPTGTRKLWYADEAALATASGHPLGFPVPARTLFISVRHRFSAAAVLKLTPAQQRVARLFYLEERVESDVAERLGISSATVKTHLKRIREKAEPFVGSTLSRAIASWLRDRPSELQQADGIAVDPQRGISSDHRQA